MKKSFSLCIVMSALLVVFLSTVTVYAYTLGLPPTVPVTLGQEIRFENGPGTTAGGEFEVYAWNSGVPGAHLFNSFCLETTEFLSYGAKFKVGGISEWATNGGYRGGNPDPIDPRTAYLYHNFYWGKLTNYDYFGDKRDASANDLQYAIWFFEDELKEGVTIDNLFTKEAIAAVTSGAWKGLGDVRAINLTDATGLIKMQDQLTVVPVPEPATLLLLGSGVIGLVGFGKRRFRKKLPLEG